MWIYKININGGEITYYPFWWKFAGQCLIIAYELDEKLQVLKIVYETSGAQYLFTLNTNLNSGFSTSMEGNVARLTSLNRKMYVRMYDDQNSLRVYEILENNNAFKLGEVNMYGFSYNYLVYQEDRIIGLKRIIDS